MAKRLASIANKVIAPSLRARGGQFNAILTNWRDIVGEELYKNCRPLSLKWQAKENISETAYSGEDTIKSQNQATLVIGCSQILAIEILHHNRQIMAKANSLLGAQYITQIKTRAIIPSSHHVTKRYTDIEHIVSEKDARKTDQKQWRPPEELSPRLKDALKKWRDHL